MWLCFSVNFIDLFSCITASLFNKLTYLLPPTLEVTETKCIWSPSLFCNYLFLFFAGHCCQLNLRSRRKEKYGCKWANTGVGHITGYCKGIGWKILTGWVISIHPWGPIQLFSRYCAYVPSASVLCFYPPPPDIGAEYCDDCVCLSVREHNLWNYMPDLSQIFAHVICVCGSVLVWLRCDMLCTSGFTNNVMFNVYIMTRNRQRNRDSVAWIYHRDVYSKWPTRGQHRAGAESAIYDCLVCVVLSLSIFCARLQRTKDQRSTVKSLRLLYYKSRIVSILWCYQSVVSESGTALSGEIAANSNLSTRKHKTSKRWFDKTTIRWRFFFI